MAGWVSLPGFGKCLVVKYYKTQLIKRRRERKKGRREERKKRKRKKKGKREREPQGYKRKKEKQHETTHAASTGSFLSHSMPSPFV